MALKSAEETFRFQPNLVSTSLYLAEFQRMFQNLHEYLDRQRQNQYSLAQYYLDAARKKLSRNPSQAEIAKLLYECVITHPGNELEPAVITMEVAEAIAALAHGKKVSRSLSRTSEDFLIEAGILRAPPEVIQPARVSLPVGNAIGYQLR